MAVNFNLVTLKQIVFTALNTRGSYNSMIISGDERLTSQLGAVLGNPYATKEEKVMSLNVFRVVCV